MGLKYSNKGIIFVISFFIITVGFCNTAAADDTTPIAYTANLLDDTASIINMNDNTVIATIYGLNLPMSVAITPDYKRIYVANSGDNTVAVINATSYQIIDAIPVGKSPYGVAVTNDGNTVYVTNTEDNTVSVINTTQLKVKNTIGVGGAPYGIRINPATNDVYVVNSNDGTVSVIKETSVVATIPVGESPTNGLAVTPDGARLFVANTDSNNVSIINTTSNKVMSSINTGTGPHGIAISPEGWYAYIANSGSGKISILQISDNTIQVSLDVANASMVAVSPDGKVLYATMPDGKVKVVNSATGEVKGIINIKAVDVGSMLVSSDALVDRAPPVTTLKLIGINDTNGNFIQEVTCNLTAVDYPSGTTINNIQYSLDGNTWYPYTGNISIKNPRTIALYYYATDKAGNKEIMRSKWITIVATAATPATPTPSPHVSLTIPPKPTALPPEEIPTVTPPSVSDKPTPPATNGFAGPLAAMGFLGAGYLLMRKSRWL